VAVASAFRIGRVRSARYRAAGSQRTSAPIYSPELFCARPGAAGRSGASSYAAAQTLILPAGGASHAPDAADGIPSSILGALRAGSRPASRAR